MGVLTYGFLFRYEALKRRLQDKLVNVFKEQYPELVEHIDYVTSGSPLSNKFYLGSKYGEVLLVLACHCYVMCL